MFLLWLNRGSGFSGKWWRGEVPFSSHCIKRIYCQHDIPITVNLNQLAEGVFVKFLHHEIRLSFLPTFLTVLFGSPFMQPIPKEVGGLCSTSLKRDCLHKLFGILLHKICIASPPSINVSVDSWTSRNFFYTLGSSSTLFCYLTCSSFDSWDLSQLAPILSWYTHYFDVVLSISLLSGACLSLLSTSNSQYLNEVLVK